jgi:hypothetical protein
MFPDAYSGLTVQFVKAIRTFFLAVKCGNQDPVKKRLKLKDKHHNTTLTLHVSLDTETQSIYVIYNIE